MKVEDLVVTTLLFRDNLTDRVRKEQLFSDKEILNFKSIESYLGRSTN
jgi:hypothetical protein